MTAHKPMGTLADSERDEVRRGVRAMLERSRAFADLAPEDRRRLAGDLVGVVSYLSDPAAGQADLKGIARKLGGPPGPALALAKDEDEQPKRGQGTGADFTGGAARELSDVMTRTVDEVDFPQFVSGLIEGVFTSIVDSSIRQMQSYMELLEVVQASASQFAEENISEADARSHLVKRFPKALTLEGQGDEARVRLNPDAEEGALPDLRSELGLDADPDFDDEEIEKQVMQASRLKMARLRQNQLLKMVMLGINRIIVTDGKINAKVVFDFSSEDTASKSDTSSSEYAVDSTTDRQSESSSFWGTDSSKTKVKTKVTSKYNRDISSASDSSLEAKAKLTGEVSINFRSETFPLDRIDPSFYGEVQAGDGKG